MIAGRRARRPRPGAPRRRSAAFARRGHELHAQPQLHLPRPPRTPIGGQAVALRAGVRLPASGSTRWASSCSCTSCACSTSSRGSSRRSSSATFGITRCCDSFVFSERRVVARMNQSQPKNQRAAIRTAVPGPESRALRAREDAHVAPGLQGYAVMAGHRRRPGAGQRGHRRRRQHATSTSSAASTSTRSGTRTRRSCDAVQEQVGQDLGRLVHLARARRARRAAGRARRRRPACTACSSTRAAPRRSRARCGSPSATPASTSSSASGAASTARRWARCR